jgi:peptidoglycan/LPS O-acetylase OafA/YrhL
LRGVGIAAVVVYHLDPAWLPGGYLGVDVFFVVSGFLITGLLLDLLTPAPSAWPALREFWTRRARRLLPALVVLLAVLSVVAGLIARDAVPRLRADIPAALGFVANWQLLFHHDSYFESMGRPPLLLHLWSLGVEEQFYLVWPFVVLGTLHMCQRPTRALCWLAGTGSMCSAVLMAVLFVPGHDPSAVYYDTFTHSAGLMIGAALAAATYNRRLAPHEYGAKPRAAIGFGALAGLALLLAVLGADGTFTYRGGILLTSALTGLAVIVAVRPGPVSRLLSTKPLRYLGTRSYSLYIWHWPIICLTRPDIDVRFSGWPLLVFRLALVLLAGETSYKLIEQPFRTGRAQAALHSLHGAGRTAAVGSLGLCGGIVVVVLAACNPPALPAALAAGSTPAARVLLPSAPVGSTSSPTKLRRASAPKAALAAPPTSTTTARATTTVRTATVRTATVRAPTARAPTARAPTARAPTARAATARAATARATVTTTKAGPRTTVPTTRARPTTIVPTTARPITSTRVSTAARATTSAPTTTRPPATAGAPNPQTTAPAGKVSAAQGGTTARMATAAGIARSVPATNAHAATTTAAAISVPVNSVPVNSVPSGIVQVNSVPTDSVPVNSVPTGIVPGNRVPVTKPPMPTVLVPASTQPPPPEPAPPSTTPLLTTPASAVPHANPRPSPPPVSSPPLTAPTATSPPTTAHRAVTTTTTPRPRLGHDVLAIGDSVLLASSQALEERLHGDITVDAVVGRQVWSGISRLAAYRAAGDLLGLRAVVIDLGTNGPITPPDVAQMRALTAGVPLLVLVNVRVPLPWQAESNASLAAARHLPGVVVVDWYRASATPGVLWADGVHPDPKGQVIYANLVAGALGL